jgi:AcrR family transcriptional regulator
MLTQALIELTLERGFEAVTVRDLTDRADIGYATFFRHYPDKDALLHDVLEDALEELVTLIQPVLGDPERTARMVFEHIGQHRDLHRVLLKTRNSGQLMQRVFEVGTHGILETLTPAPNAVVPPEIAAHHMIASFLELIDYWLEHDLPYPPERMGAIVTHLVMNPTRAVAFVARKSKRKTG